VKSVKSDQDLCTCGHARSYHNTLGIRDFFCMACDCLQFELAEKAGGQQVLP
jgi:hypothetical protein